MADAQDLKSCSRNRECGFESHPRHMAERKLVETIIKGLEDLERLKLESPNINLDDVPTGFLKPDHVQECDNDCAIKFVGMLTLEFGDDKTPTREDVLELAELCFILFRDEYPNDFGLKNSHQLVELAHAQLILLQLCMPIWQPEIDSEKGKVMELVGEMLRLLDEDSEEDGGV